jgi:hypothetical protein
MSSNQRRDEVAVIINSHLHELAVDDALSALSTLSADSAKEKWGRLPAHVKTAVTKVRALSVALVTLRGRGTVADH